MSSQIAKSWGGSQTVRNCKFYQFKDGAFPQMIQSKSLSQCELNLAVFPKKLIEGLLFFLHRYGPEFKVLENKEQLTVWIISNGIVSELPGVVIDIRFLQSSQRLTSK